MKTRLITLLMLAPALLSSCFTTRAVRWWQPDLQDVNKFNYVTVKQSAQPFSFTFATDLPQNAKANTELDSFLRNTNTTAFVVIRNDSVLYERYEEGKSRASIHPSFSVAKSFIGTLVGIMADRGVINVNASVVDYLPQLLKNDARFAKLTVQHVLDMRAALDFDENKETPFAAITKLYYGRSLNRQINRLKLKGEPGKAFEYQSVCTQLLAAILEKATGKPVQQLLRDELWQPLGMESDALWSVDDKNAVKAFCCLNATALDFAKLGRLYLNNGNWNGKQIISRQWVETTTNPDTLYQHGYKNQWWGCADNRAFDNLAAAEKFAAQHAGSRAWKSSNGRYYVGVKNGDYRAEGILGQIAYVNPKRNIIIVRTGTYPNKPVYFNGFIAKLGRQL